MPEKQFIEANQLLLDSFKLGKKILDSGFKPSFIITLWRGGAPIGMAVQEFLAYHGIKTDNITIRTSAYESIDSQNKEILVHGLGYVENNIKPNMNILIVDDVYDTGLSMNKVLKSLKERLKDNIPKEIKVATVYYKPTRNKTNRKPDFYIHETDKWLIFPHELKELTIEEVKQKGIDTEGLF